jgi:hypothetical protein
VTNRTVLLKTSGLDARMSTTCEMYQAPKSGSQFGCSVYDSGATIHDTCGSMPFRTSHDDVLNVFYGACSVIRRNCNARAMDTGNASVPKPMVCRKLRRPSLLIFSPIGEVCANRQHRIDWMYRKCDAEMIFRCYSLLPDVKRSRQTKPDKAFGTNYHWSALLCGASCYSGTGADTGTDRGSFSSSEECSEPSTGQSSNTSVLRCLLTFTPPTKCNDVAGDRTTMLSN